MVSVPEKFSVSQRCCGLWHGQGRLVIAHLHGQGDANPVDYGTIINFLCYVDDGVAETGTCLCRRKIPLKEYPDESCREVDRLTDTKGFHVNMS